MVFTFKQLRSRIKGFIRRTTVGKYVSALAELLIGELELLQKRPFRAHERFCTVLQLVESDGWLRKYSNNRYQTMVTLNGKQIDYSRVRTDFLTTRYAIALRGRFNRHEFPRNVLFRDHLLPLKEYNSATGEKGVVVVSFNEYFQALHSVFNIEELKRSYWIVLEPSVHYPEDPGYALFRECDAILQAGRTTLRDQFTKFDSIFHVVQLSNSDWTDSDVFTPLPGRTKKYDLICVANWSRNKSHEVLFETLAGIKRKVKLALVGFPLNRGKDEIDKLLKTYHLSEQVDIFENLEPARVNELLNESRVNVLLSRFEASNKGLTEAMFANLPSVVYRHMKGQDLSCINDQTGVLADDDELAETINTVLDDHSQFSPREWALKHTGYLRSTLTLNERLKKLSEEREAIWTTDIVHKVNRPNLAYKDPQNSLRFEPSLRHLLTIVRN